MPAYCLGHGKSIMGEERLAASEIREWFCPDTAESGSFATRTPQAPAWGGRRSWGGTVQNSRSQQACPFPVVRCVRECRQRVPIRARWSACSEAAAFVRHERVRPVGPIAPRGAPFTSSRPPPGSLPRWRCRRRGGAGSVRHGDEEEERGCAICDCRLAIVSQRERERRTEWSPTSCTPKPIAWAWHTRPGLPPHDSTYPHEWNRALCHAQVSNLSVRNTSAQWHGIRGEWRELEPGTNVEQIERPA